MHDAACDENVGGEDFSAVDEDIALDNCDHEVGAQHGGDAATVLKGGAVGYGTVDHCGTR